MKTFYEFFSGGGMARLGLGQEWRCVFANDIDKRKAETYQNNFNASHEFKLGDISSLTSKDLAGQADLAWASFPCQDLSLAGAGRGLKGDRSGLFWEFWRLISQLRKESRNPSIIVIENVYGAITSHSGGDLAAICQAFSEQSYRFAPIVVDASLFLPQSRPRLFIVGFAEGIEPPNHLSKSSPIQQWHPDAFGMAYDQLSQETRSKWLWLDMPSPPKREIKLVDLIEDEPTGVNWHSPFETNKLISIMSPINYEKVKSAKESGERQIGAIYKRTRIGDDGIKKQRAEVRFDDVAGCLRTPSGGSSRQIILVVEGKRVRSRLLSPREAARLMGIDDNYILPERYNDAYRLAGDGVAVPVVSWIVKHIVENSLSMPTMKRASSI